jgi:hypothetical protein
MAAPASALPPASGRGSMPQVGDRWTYRLTLLDRKDETRQQRYAVNVTSVTGGAVSDRYALDDGRSGPARHEGGSYVLGMGPAVFSPYLGAFHDLSSGTLGRTTVRDGTCPADYSCAAEARVVGHETVSVPAGKFDTVKVAVTHTWNAASAGSGHQAYIAQMNGGRTMTVWYAPEARRAVKFSSRVQAGDYPAVESNFDLELEAYELKAPSAGAALALAAPAPEAPRALAGLPKPGDTWTYRLTDLDRKDEYRQQRYTVNVTAVADNGIAERFSLESGPAGLVRHGPGGYLASAGAALFSPYLPLFQELAAGAGIAPIVVRDGACAADYLCDAQARVVGRETVSVPAGRFDAVKVAVTNAWRSNGSGHQLFIAQMNGARTITIWYAPEVKRAVKFSSRLEHGVYPAVDSNFDLELTGYQLK